MKRSHRLLCRAIDLSIEKNLENEVKLIIEPFMKDADSLDLWTICRLEVLLGEKLLIVPNKQQWRKIKLERLNEISKNEKTLGL
jgi:virulence-associated protein VagC